MSQPRAAVYVLGPEGCGKSDLIHHLKCLQDGALSCLPKRVPATTGQNIQSLSLVEAAAADGSTRTGSSATDVADTQTVEVREIGGALLPAWESFLVSRMARRADAAADTQDALLFVVDATAPHQLSVARYAYQWLKESAAAPCRGWPTAVVLQKCGAPGALAKAEVAAWLGVDVAKGAASHPATLWEVDSWNGLGVGDVLWWVTQVAATASR